MSSVPSTARGGSPPASRPEAYLFDLDGVLVRTEELHFAAYRAVAAQRGRVLPWDFPRYCIAAHYGPERLRAELAAALPGLLPDRSAWDDLYRDKSRLYLDLVSTAPVELLPGAAATLQRLAAAGVPRAVVTNATRAQTAAVRRRQPVLDSAPVWVTREDYAEAKPAPDCYRLALERLGVPAGAALGFEDTPRGIQALAAAGVAAVLVTSARYPELGAAPRLILDSLAALPEELLPASPSAPP
jgi:HAD superfamily hydrolase (TIGR01509 family)